MSRLLALSGETVRVQDRDRRSCGFTITAFDPAAGLYLGLAHASADVKAGDLPIPTKAREPAFGEGLIFYWGSNAPIYPHPLLGSIIFCNDYGVCGRLKRAPKQGLLWTAEAQKGPAYIITNVCVNIQDLISETIPAVAVPIEITALENKGCGNWGKPSFTFTGPRFKGMSGSPIIQDGRIVGALRGANADGTGVGLHIDQMLNGLYKGVLQVQKNTKKSAKRRKGKFKNLHDLRVRGTAEKSAALEKQSLAVASQIRRAQGNLCYLKAMEKELPRHRALVKQVIDYEAGRISEGVLREKQKRSYLEALKFLWSYNMVHWKMALKTWEGWDITREQRVAIERCVSFET